MRALIQRVSSASVRAEGEEQSRIGSGLLVLLGVEQGDKEADRDWLCRKIANLRIFDDKEGVMNRSLLDTDGDLIVVSQFTLLGATKKGNRPSYTRAARPGEATRLYDSFVAEMQRLLGKPVGTGVFGAHMEVELINDGPVTLWIDTRNKE